MTDKTFLRRLRGVADNDGIAALGLVQRIAVILAGFIEHLKVNPVATGVKAGHSDDVFRLYAQ